MLVGVLDLLLITMVFFKILANLRILQWKVKKCNNLVTKIIHNHVTQCSYHKWHWKLRFKSFKCYMQFNIILHVIRLPFAWNLYVVVCHSNANTFSYYLTRHSYVLVCDLYPICMSLVCARISVCHSYVIPMPLVCTRMSLVCHSYVTSMSLVCTNMPSVCHSYVILTWTHFFISFC